MFEIFPWAIISVSGRSDPSQIGSCKLLLLKIYNRLGQGMDVLVNEEQSAGWKADLRLDHFLPDSSMCRSLHHRASGSNRPATVSLPIFHLKTRFIPEMPHHSRHTSFIEQSETFSLLHTRSSGGCAGERRTIRKMERSAVERQRYFDGNIFLHTAGNFVETKKMLVVK